MKLRGMDGPVDLCLYRPIGFAIAWCLSRTKMRPNAVTLFSLLLGVAAGAAATAGTASGFLLCAILFQASNCFDCADGQLARLTGRFSREGRILDGVSDYAVNICVYLGSLAGLVRSGDGRLHSLLLVAAGGAAMAFSCAFYDRAVTRYAAQVEGRGDEGEEPEAALERAAASKGLLRLLWRAYAGYLRLQALGDQGAKLPAPAGVKETSEASKKAYSELMMPLLMAWSFAGPSAHVLYFLVFAAIGKPRLFFVAAVVVAGVTVLFLVLQQLVDLRLRAKGFAEE